MARRPTRSRKQKEAVSSAERAVTRDRALPDSTVEQHPRHQAHASLSDAEIERALTIGDNPGLLEEIFGEKGYEELRDLANEAASRPLRSGRRVLILPGIMGSKLSVPRPLLFDNTIWLDPVSIAAGGLARLRVAPEGDAGDVKATGVILSAYLALKLRLKIAGYDADFVPLDWRLSLTVLGAALARTIESEAAAEVCLVAHSMGGLVARAALAHNPRKLKRVVTLGTPNYGSYSPIQAFRGAHSVVQKVALLDVHHTPTELAAIFGTFRGLLEMIPSPQRRPTDFFDDANWPSSGARPATELLRAARSAQADLPPPNADFFLVVGRGNETVVDARLDRDRDEYVYDLSPEGDGTVPLDLARVSERPTWVTDVTHGSMPNSARLAAAVDDLLATGSTNRLQTLEASLQRVARQAAPVRRVTESELAQRAQPPGKRGRSVSARELRHIVDEFAAPLAGPDRDAPQIDELPRPVAPAGGGAVGGGSADQRLVRDFVVARRVSRRLDVDLAFGSITGVRADAYVVGIFHNVRPGGAAAAIDRDLDGALRQLVDRRMVSGEAGQISTLPTGRHRFGAGVVMLAGLGSIAEFKPDLLELVGENVMRTALLSRLDDFAMVPITGSAGSDAGAALEHLLRGFIKGLRSVPQGQLRRVTICELDRDKFEGLRQTFYRLLRSDMFDDIEVTLNEIELPPVQVTRAGAVTTARDPVYLMVRQDAGAGGRAAVVASVLTSGGKAGIVQRWHPVDSAAIDSLAAELSQRGLTAADAARFGRELAEMVLHPDIRAVIAVELKGRNGVGARSLVVVHDGPMSRIPWETLNLEVPNPGTITPALDGGLTHRFDGTALSVAKWNEARVQMAGLSVLLVVDPTEDLSGAKMEGARIRTLLEGLPGVKLDILEGKKARKAELLALFQSGDYDVIHYAGHAFFDAQQPSRSGIICAGKEVLSGADLAGLSQLPSLVFFNACEAARVRKPGGQEEKTKEIVRGAVGFAEAFLAGGVANYLGTYWPVDDAGAKVFAEAFYPRLLKGETIGEALIEGRKAVLALGIGDWANYILYGSEAFRLVPPRGTP